jgi:hopene-associated glycosyltransferase HpnB
MIRSAWPIALSVLSLLIWLNLTFMRAWFWRFREPLEVAPHGDANTFPQVTAVIPARDEAAHIGGCVTALLKQDYPGPFSVIVVDDSSSDATAEVAHRAALELDLDARLSVVTARPLPEGWSGKVWAQSEGCELIKRLVLEGRAEPEYLWFTDADIIHRPGVLRGLVKQAQGAGLVLNSHMVHLRCKSFAERSLVPAFVFFFAMLYPFEAVSNPKRRAAAAAGGSMLVKRAALERAGGMNTVRKALIDDCAMGAMMKKQGPIRLALGHASFSIRPYPGFIDIWRMIARTAYTQLRYSPVILLGTVLGLVLTYLAPPLLALLAHGTAAALGALAWALMAICFVPIARIYRRPVTWGLALPGIACFYLAATVGSAWQHWRGRGGTWKNRHQGSALAATEMLDHADPSGRSSA